MPIPFPTSSASGPWSVPGIPLLPRLELEPTMSRDGVFDGAWWPRSNRVLTEHIYVSLLPDQQQASAEAVADLIAKHRRRA
ncbi:DUF5994 family protein [Kitasatospora aburaviensis]